MLPAFVIASTSASPTFKPTVWNILLLVAELAVGVGGAELRRRRRGNYPWRLHSIIWGVFMFLTQGFALILLVIAWFTTNDSRPARGRLIGSGLPTAGAGSSRWGGARQVGNPVGVGAPGTAGATGATGATGDPMVPGTYGTSLPPSVNGTSATASKESAGWRPDPTGRHEYRYWTGSSWSKRVSDKGTQSSDPL